MADMEEKQGLLVENREKDTGFCQKLVTILKKDVINVLRNPLILQAKVFQSIFMGLFVGGVYFALDQRNQYT